MIGPPPSPSRRDFLRRALAAIPLLVGSPVAGAARDAAPSAMPPAPTRPNAILPVLTAPSSDFLADDVKLLLGWAFDAAAARIELVAGRVIDRSSGFAAVPGFAAPTALQTLRGRYRLLQAPFDEGGYWGLAVALLDAVERETAIILLSRLFRLPVILHEPGGVATDILTNGGLFFGYATAAIRAATAAAEAAYAAAGRAGVPLIAAGQSQAGGVAQLQIASLLQRVKQRPLRAGFLTINAAYATVSIKRLGLRPEEVPGINFVKDLDPGFGPHSLLANEVGWQIYIHPDGTAGRAPGAVGAVQAFAHPREHFLDSFADVSLAAALRSVLAAEPVR